MKAREANSSDAIRGELIALLKSHRHELEDAVIARIRSSELGARLDAEALAGLRPAAVESVKSLLTAIEEGDSWSPTVPPAVVAQIQYLARRGASLDRVLRGYSIVGTAFLEFLAEKLGDLPQSQNALRYAASMRSRNDDRLMSAFAAEYAKEMERLNSSPSHHLAERVQSLLAGGSGDYVDLGYQLDACHIGLVAVGARAELVCRNLAETLGCELLLLPRAEDTIWAWVGARRQIRFADLEQLVARGESTSFSLAAGEPRNGVDGWRLTHREARAALAVALLEPQRLTRYSAVALLAAALGNEATGRSLVDRYLGPLDQHRDGNGLRKTLRTYLDLDCNAASTAAALGVDRHTVQRRLRRVEEAIGEPLASRRAELAVALRLERLLATVAAEQADKRTADGTVATT